MCCFPVARDLDGSGMLSNLLSSDHILYFEWLGCCEFSLGDLSEERLHWSHGTGGAKSSRISPTLRLVKLVVLELTMLAGPELCRAPFELDLLLVCGDREARFNINLFVTGTVVVRWTRYAGADVTPAAMLWREYRFVPIFFNSNDALVCFWVFIGWHQRWVKVSVAHALPGRYVPLLP